jgi:hypothetical protein
MNVMKSAAVGAAAGAVLGGLAVIPYLSMAVFIDVFAKSLFNSLAGRSDEPYIFNENLVPEYIMLKSVCIGIVLGGVVGAVCAVARNCFFNRDKKGSN